MNKSKSIMEEYEKSLRESLTDYFPWDMEKLREGAYDKKLDLRPLGVINKTYFIEINGNKYGYEAAPGSGKDIREIARTFEHMISYGRGAALAWLRDKNNTKIVSGSVKGISPIMR